MIKYDSSGDRLASVEASGTPDELVKDIVMLTVSLVRGMVQSGDFLPAIYVLKTVGETLSSEDLIKDVLFNGNMDEIMIVVNPKEGESDEDTRKRATLEAIRRFANKVTLDEDWNVISEDESEDERE